METMLIFIISTVSFAQNPLIMDQFTADPSARVFGEKVYVFPFHEILAKEGQGQKGWFCMEDYHVFSSANLTDWTDRGMIIQQNKVPWVKPDSNSMWTPDCIERNGKYYFYFPSIPKDTINNKKGFAVGVAIADKPLGSFKPKGVIMVESPTGCWINHHSIIEFKNEWILFYHHNDLSPQFDKLRSIRADYLHFNSDGTIQKVICTLRGVGVTNAKDKIQIYRYSKISDRGTSISFLDDLKTFNKSAASIQYDTVDFGQERIKTVAVKAFSEKEAVVQICTKGIGKTVIAEVIIPKGSNGQEIKPDLLKFNSGIQNLFVVDKGDNQVEIDWIKFEKKNY